MKYSKTTLMELSHKYKNVLKKCALLNAMILMGAMIAVPAMAEYEPVEERQVISEATEFDNKSFTGLGTGTTSGSGGAIYTTADLTISNSLFDSNMANTGAAIYNQGATLNIQDTDFKSNKLNGGGVIANAGTLNITGGSFVGNEGKLVSGNYLYGTSIYNLANATTVIDGTKFTNNMALIGGTQPRAYGSVLFSGTNAKATIKNSTLSGNAGQYMGGLIQSNGGSTLVLENDTFENNNFIDGKATGASVIYTNTAKVTIADSTFRGNAGSLEAGIIGGEGANVFTFEGKNIFDSNKESAISVNGYGFPNITFAENGTNEFTANEAVKGAAIKNFKHANGNTGTYVFKTGTTNTFFENVATENGGAIFNEGTFTTEKGSTATFTDNKAKQGGAIYNEGTLTLNGTATFSGNTADGVANDIYNTGDLTIGGTIALTGADSGDGNITGDGSVTFTSGSLLKGTMLNSATPLINVGTLDVKEGAIADLTFDIADQEATWTYAVADTWTGADFTLSDATQNLNALFDVKAGAEKGTLVVTRKPVDDIVDNMEKAGATETEADTVAAIAQVETASIADAAAREVAAAIKEAAQTGDMATVKELTDRVNPAEAPVKHVVSATTAIMGAVTTRMSVAANTPAPAVGRSGGDLNDDNSPNLITNLSPWVQGLYNKTHNSQGIGFDAYSKGFAFGADTRLNDAWTLGVGYAYTATDVKNVQRKTQIYGDNYFIYGEYKPSNWYVNGVLAMGKAKYKDVSVLTSNYDVDSYSGQVLAGYQTGLLNNYAGMRYTLIKTEEYNNGLTTVDAKNTQVATAIIGTKISKDFGCEKGVVWTPEFRLAGTYDVKSEASKATVGIIGGTSTYSVTGDRLSRAALETGVGLTAKVKKFEFIGGYDVELRSQNNTQAVNLKAIYHF